MDYKRFREGMKSQFKGTARKNPGASPERFDPQKAQGRSRDAYMSWQRWRLRDQMEAADDVRRKAHIPEESE